MLPLETRAYLQSLDEFPVFPPNIDNPLCGFKMTQVKSSAPFTEVLIVKHAVFQKYVSEKSPYSKVSEKQLRYAMEKELGLQDASS